MNEWTIFGHFLLLHFPQKYPLSFLSLDQSLESHSNKSSTTVWTNLRDLSSIVNTSCLGKLFQDLAPCATTWKVSKIRSFFWSVCSCIWTEYRKILTKKTPFWTLFTNCIILLVSVLYKSTFAEGSSFLEEVWWEVAFFHFFFSRMAEGDRAFCDLSILCVLSVNDIEC